MGLNFIKTLVNGLRKRIENIDGLPKITADTKGKALFNDGENPEWGDVPQTDYGVNDASKSSHIKNRPGGYYEFDENAKVITPAKPPLAYTNLIFDKELGDDQTRLWSVKTYRDESVLEGDFLYPLSYYLDSSNKDELGFYLGEPEKAGTDSVKCAVYFVSEIDKIEFYLPTKAVEIPLNFLPKLEGDNTDWGLAKRQEIINTTDTSRYHRIVELQNTGKLYAPKETTPITAINTADDMTGIITSELGSRFLVESSGDYMNAGLGIAAIDYPVELCVYTVDFGYSPPRFYYSFQTATGVSGTFYTTPSSRKFLSVMKFPPALRVTFTQDDEGNWSADKNWDDVATLIEAGRYAYAVAFNNNVHSLSWYHPKTDNSAGSIGFYAVWIDSDEAVTYIFEWASDGGVKYSEQSVELIDRQVLTNLPYVSFINDQDPTADQQAQARKNIGLTPVAKTDAMTQSVGLDAETGELYTTPAAGDESLGITSASVGQLIKVQEVDGDGKPTKWKAVNDRLPEPGPSDNTKALAVEQIGEFKYGYGFAHIPNLNDFIDLGITNASPGKFAKVKFTDDFGQPTAWEAVDVESDNIVLTSSTTGSTKKFRIVVDDSGTLSAVEVTDAS